jgi:5-methyltetrahydrofolate--homocysteine methyltransferase
VPDRSLLNQALIASAVEKHATFLIMNPLDETAMGVVNASRVLFVGGSLHDFLEQYRKRARVSDSRKDLVSAIVHGDVSIGCMQAEKLLDAGINAQELVESHLAKGLEIVGANYEQGKFYIPDLLKAAEVARAVLLVMRRRLPRAPKRGTILLATVKGDIHDIGKRLAAAIFESAGYVVVDLGVDVAAEAIVKAVRRHKPDFLGLSALLTTTMSEMENVVKALKNAGLDVKVIVGGPNVSTAYAQKIGAFGAARSVFEGLKLIRRRNRSVVD